MIHPDTKELTWAETSDEADALIEEMQDVLQVAQLRGIAEKHLRLAYDRGRLDERNKPNGDSNP